MAFVFKRKESVATAVRRLGRTRAETALTCLKDCRHTEAIHCVRKEIKKSRAVLRLARSSIREKECRRLMKLLRDAADHLAPVRDAHVKTTALKNLTGHFKGQLKPAAMRRLRTALRAGLRRETNQFKKRKTARAVERLLRQAAKRFADLRVTGKGWAALESGVKATYAEGRAAYRITLKEPVAENFHEWRRRVKDLWYDVRMLQPIWPEQLDAGAEELKLLGEQLGDDHDLFMLQQFAEKQNTGTGSQREIETLAGLIGQRQRELREAALKLGARFYTEKPSVFANRLGQYWRLWHREQKADAVRATR